MYKTIVSFSAKLCIKFLAFYISAKVCLKLFFHFHFLQTTARQLDCHKTDAHRHMESKRPDVTDTVVHYGMTFC